MKITNAKFLVSSAKVSQCPLPNLPEYAFIGRSNVGKSSLINMLTSRNKLAKVSGNPGKTTLINHFQINIKNNTDEKGWYLVDLPGYGFAKRSKKQRKDWQKMITDYLRQRKNLQTIFVLIDSRLPPQKIDLDFINKLGEWRLPFNLIFTKSDKNKGDITHKNVRQFKKDLSNYWEFLPEAFISSSVKKTGRLEVLNFIEEINQHYWINHEANK